MLRINRATTRVLHNTYRLEHQRRLLSTTNPSTPTPTTTNPSTNVFGIAGGVTVTIAGVLLGGITYYINEEVGGSEGMKRTLSFYSLAIPSYIKYRAHMILQSNDETWEKLDNETSQAGLLKILELGGFYTKSGQMCASNIGNAFPKVWQDTMSVLQDQCPYQPYSVIKAIIEEEYGNVPLHTIFSSFDPTPIGSASIGQVHRATLRSDGDTNTNTNTNNNNNINKDIPVVVKIQYPNVENVFRGDVRTIKMFAQIAQPVHVPPLIEIEKQFMTEFDYVQEAKQMNRIRDNLMMTTTMTTSSSSSSSSSSSNKNKQKHNPKVQVKVPKAYTELCTRRILVMEELKGDKLVDALQQDLKHHAQRNNMTVEQYQMKTKNEQQQQQLSQQLSQSQSQQLSQTKGPTAQEYNTYIQLLNTKRNIHNLYNMFYNYTIGLLLWLPGGGGYYNKKKKVYQSRDILPLNHAQIVDDLIHIHGHEVLVDGCFNGDPHPGNILLLGVQTGNTKLGLIDYGQVKELTKEERHLMCKIIIALSNNDKPTIITLMKEAGFQSKYMDEDVIYKYAKVSYDEDNDELTNGMHIQMFMEDLQSKDPILSIPDQYIMVGRASIMLRGLAHALQQSRSVADAWRPIAEQVLRDEL